MNITIWKRKKYYYNILRVLMTIYTIGLVAILYSWLMAIIMAHFQSKFSSYYSNLSSIRTSIVATIVTSQTN